MVKTAKSLGMTACGLTDHGTFAGAIEFLRTCRKEGIRPILGMEAYMSKCHTARGKEEQPLGRRGNRHINLIAKNYTGFQNICTLSQTASLDGFYYDPRLDAELLWKHREGVIATSACLSNTINHFLAENEYDKAKRAVASFKDIFGSDFYLEMMFHGIAREAKILPEIQRLAKDMDVKIIITNDCFIAGTMILTNNGVVPIEDLQIGDKVVTHKNRLKNIEHINSRVVQDVYTVKTNLGTTALVSTGGHPVFVTRRKTSTTFTIPEWKEVSTLSSDDYLILHKTPYDRHRLTRKDCPLHVDIPLVLGEECSENIQGGVYVTTQGYDGLRGQIKIPLQLPLCPDLLFILGRYIAEGWCDKSCHQMGFASNCGEIEIQDRIADYFSQFGVTCYRPRSEKNDCKIVFSSKIFHALFTKLCGVGALNKHLPMINGSYHQFSFGQMLEIIKGYIGRDGHIASKKHRTSVVCATVSRVLAYQISEILQAMGFVSLPTLRSYEKAAHKNPKADPLKWNPLYVLNMSEIDIERLCDMLKINRIKNDRSEITRRKFIDIGDYFAVKVRSVTQSVQEEMVYNLQVENDESYVANSYIVHNCHYIRQEDAEFHEVVMCISSGRTLKDPKRLKFPHKEFYFKSKDEMAAIFGGLPRAMNNTLEIAEKCDYSDIIFVEEGGTMKLPHFDIPVEFKTPYEYLEKMAKDGLIRLGLAKSKPHVERLKTELGDIKLIWDTKRYDFATYFLVVQDIMRFAKEKDINAGVRGSGYGSLLLKCIGIVEGVIDPLEFDLLWERFLGFDDKLFLTEDDFGPVATEEQILAASQD